MIVHLATEGSICEQPRAVAEALMETPGPLGEHLCAVMKGNFHFWLVNQIEQSSQTADNPSVEVGDQLRRSTGLSHRGATSNASR